MSAESLLMVLPLKMAAVEEGYVVEEADDYPGGAVSFQRLLKWRGCLILNTPSTQFLVLLKAGGLLLSLLLPGGAHGVSSQPTPTTNPQQVVLV